MVVILQKLRKKRHITQQELSVSSGVRQQVISKIERGKTISPGVDVMHRLAKALRCTVDDLIEEDDDATN